MTNEAQEVQELFNKLIKNPDNPRTATDEKLRELMYSIKDFPKMLEIRYIVYDSSDDFKVLGGNQRLDALRELVKDGFELKAEYFKDVGDLSDIEKKKFIIKDNVPSGDWDKDIIDTKWGDLPLEEWGVDLNAWKPSYYPDFDDSEVSQQDVINAQGKINEGIGNRELKTVNLVCPECGHEFSVKV